MSLASSVRREVARLDAGIAIAHARALDTVRTDSMAERRVVLLLVGVFAAAALRARRDRPLRRHGIFGADATAGRFVFGWRSAPDEPTSCDMCYATVWR